MRIALLAVDGLFDSGLSSLLDVLATANALRTDAPAGGSPFDVTVVSTQAEVRTGHGLRLATTPLTDLADAPDVLVMPAVGFKAPAQVVDIVRDHAALAEVVALHEAGSALAAACSGTFFLAEANLLDGLVATTSWWLGPAFRSRYPAVRLDESRTLVRDGQVTTAGAAFAHIDLALSIVQQESPALADLVARYLVIGDRPSQAVFAVPSHLASNDPTVTAFEQWVRDHLADSAQISGAAAAIGVSERTLQRTTAAVLGMSPIDFVHEIRLDQATFLLRTTSQTVDAVAAAVGYQNTSTLRALVRRRRGTTISALRVGRPDWHTMASGQSSRSNQATSQ
ncbi:MAG TPA: helix-turn-helix domain-containing protein [Pseudonocardiaceae bacterium]|jgi:transcriptional regulator GlxA family with amidase domain|nr:helix-turn-helix domain-containing protein [Pseudonocardiaceae bacterium]